jgi:hypothetical protein
MKRLLSSRSSASFIFPCVKFVPVASLSRFFPTGRHRCRGSSILEGIAVEVRPYWKCNQTVLSYFRCHSCVTFPFGLVCVLASFLCAVASLYPILHASLLDTLESCLRSLLARTMSAALPVLADTTGADRTKACMGSIQSLRCRSRSLLSSRA